ncbi:MAG: porin family protein, partial [Betaproteobacteria bacterium]|nr:porin family protein [Betaproteobacteria bacterium]
VQFYNYEIKGMKMKKIALAVLAIAGLAGASTAFASDDGWYVLVGAGQPTGNSDQSLLDNALIAGGARGFSSSLSKPTVYKLQAGYQINKNFAVEGGYLGSNNETYTATGGNLAGPVTASGNVTGWNLTAVGILPIANQFSLLGKLGVATIRDSATATGPGGTFSASGTKTDATYGLGAKYDFTNAVFVRLDVDSINVGSSASSSRSTVWTIDLGYKF